MNSQGIFVVHQHGPCFTVLGRQDDRHGVMWKRSKFQFQMETSINWARISNSSVNVLKKLPMILRAAVCKYREFNIKTEISKFFISSHENPLVKHFGTSQSKFPNNYLFRKKRSKVKYCVHAIPALCQSPKIIAKKPSGRKAAVSYTHLTLPTNREV